VGRIAQPPEVVERAELRMDGVVAAFAATDRVCAPYVAWLAAQAVVLPLTVCVSDWVDGCQIKNVKAHVANGWQTVDHVVERAVLVESIGRRARE
jgi:hypothetical protein